MSKEAIKQAIKVLKTCRENLFLKDYVEHIDQTIKELKEALAQSRSDVNQEQRSVSEHTGEPVAWINSKRDITYIYGPYNADDIPLYTTPQPKQSDSVEQSISVGEPVAWIPIIDGVSQRPLTSKSQAEELKALGAVVRPLVFGDTTPQPIGFAVIERPWIGLTDEEVLQIRENLQAMEGVSVLESLTKAIEAKLKENNR